MWRRIFQFRVEHLFVVITLVATLLTIVALSSSFDKTKSDVGDSGHSLMLVACLLPPMVGICFRRTRIPSLLAIVLICLVFGIRQSSVAQQLEELRQEVRQIAAYVEKFKVDNGHYPADLSGFNFPRQELRQQIEFGLDPDRTAYYIWFNPNGPPNLGHYYYSTYGFWRDND